MRVPRWWSLGVACVCACSLAARAEAREHPGSAKESAPLLDARAAATFKEGIAAFDRKDFEAARIAFLQTFALKPDAAVVRRNLGLSEIYSGHYLEGARRLARVLHTTAEGSAEDRARMQESLKLAEGHLERITVEVDQPGAEIRIDGVNLGRSPLRFLWYVAPGLYRVRVDKPGFTSYSESRLARAGSAQHLRVVLRPFVTRPRPAAVPMAESSVELPRLAAGPNPWLLLTGGALTAGALAAGAVFSISAASSKDRAEQLRADLRGFSCKAPNVIGCGELRRATREHDRHVQGALFSFVGAGLTGAATLLYGVFGGAGEEPVAGEEAAPGQPPWQLRAEWRRGPYAAWAAHF